ncbi:MAG TPA: DJ-1/PfpI family protein [Myxococcaceae bacterium]|nr:DJ-1/PfpI family protein [Myxococcaceae bacterium]
MRSFLRVGLSCLLGSSAAVASPQRSVAIVVHDGVELLDFAGPGEVFAATGAFRVFTVAPRKGPVISQGFLRVVPDYSIDDSPKPDIVLVPGGSTEVLLADARFMAWLKKTAAEDALTVSVCSGALTLAKAGLLDGLRATSHYGVIPGLKKDYPKVTVVDDVRFVDNGKVITTAGVSAGIDGALHVVERLLGTETAWRTARYMMYAWEPAETPAAEKAELRAIIFRDWEKLAALETQRLAASPDDPVALRRLGTAQAGQGKLDQGVASFERSLAKSPGDAQTTLELGRALHQQKRWVDAAKRFDEAAVQSPFYWASYNAACAHARAGDKDAALAALRRTIDGGFSQKAMLDEDDDLASLRGDPRFKALVAKLK